MSYGSRIASVQDALQNITQSQFSNIDEVEQKYKDQVAKTQVENQKKTVEGEVLEGLGVPTTIAGITSYAKGLLAKRLGQSSEETGQETGQEDDGDVGDDAIDAVDAVDVGDAGDMSTQAANLLGKSGGEMQGENIEMQSMGGNIDDAVDAGQTAETSFSVTGAGSNAASGSIGDQLQPMRDAMQARNQGNQGNQGYQGNQADDESEEEWDVDYGADEDDGTQMQSMGGDADDESGEGADEAGEAEESGEGIGESVLDDIGESSLADLIPGIGQGLAIVGGLVGLGEGLYHVFHHKSAPPVPAPPVVAGFQPPSQLTQKFADAVPSIDTAVNRSGSIGAF